MDRFKELVEEFAENNFSADGCRECNELCHSIMPNDFKDGHLQSFLG